jgi:HAD superfamily hydrolase (TIGR01450 family)
VTIADRFDVFLFDLDGVIRLGGEALPGAVDAVRRLDGMGKELRFLTNDPRPRRRTVLEHLGELGIRARVDQVVTSGWATARHLRRVGLATASTVGSDGLRSELRARGVELTERDPDAVVVGADERTTYGDIRRATRHIDRGAEFVGTNPDGAFPTPDGPSPGAGAIVRAVEVASGKEPTVVGKPGPLMFELALEAAPDAARAVMVGDSVDTDVLGAHRAGLTGILVAGDGPARPTGAGVPRPDATISTLADLFTRAVEPRPDDGRVRAARLTDDGLEARALLDRLGDDLARSVLSWLDESQRARLAEALGVVKRLLTAGMVQFDVADPTSPDGRHCLDAYFDELDGRFEDGFDPDRSISADADELTEPDGLLLLARLHGEPVGCGALKFHDHGPAELKRMWVDPSARGLGLGRRILAELEEQARRHDVRTVRLETNRALAEALRLYRSAGFEEVDPFNDEPYAHHWFEKRLDPDPGGDP